MKQKKIFIIDAMAMAFRSYHAMGVRPLQTSKGLPTSAIYGSLTILMKLIEDEKPDYLIVACDSREKTFRHQIYDQYKANRTEFPEDLSVQMPAFFRMFEVLDIPMLRHPGFEADDIIGTLVTQLASDENHCYIVSGDKDFMQLVSDKVFLYSPQSGGKVKLVDTAGVRERFGCRPDQVVDVLSLTGDTSDNVPGVKGIGDKGASKLIETYDNLDNLYKHIDEVANVRQREALIKQKEQAYLSRELVSIHKVMTLDYKIPEKTYDWDSVVQKEDLFAFLEEQEFRTIVKRLRELHSGNTKNKKTLKLGAHESKTLAEVLPHYRKDSIRREYTLVNTKPLFEDLVKELLSVKEFAFDTETTGLNSIDDRAIGISFGTRAGHAFYVPLLAKHLIGLEESQIIEALRPVFQNTETLKIAHNLKFDIKMLLNSQIPVEGPFGDTVLISFLLDTAQSHGIDALSKKFLHVYKIPTTELMGEKYKTPMSEVDLDLLSYYACEDADCCLRLYYEMYPKLKKEQLESLYHDVELPLTRILADMEQTGVYVNVPSLKTLSQSLALRIQELESLVFEQAGESFNLNSPKQLQTIIFDKLKIHESLGVTKIKKTKSGLSTDVSVLESLSEHPLIQSLLEYRTVSKLKSTYTDTLPEMVNKKTQRIHTIFNQIGTGTGRLSSTDPNLQNIPIHSEIGQKIRAAFEGQGDKVLISADYSQIELRLLAHISGDKNLREAFLTGKDIHKTTAAKILGKSEEDLTHEERNQAKAINYGVAYGMGPNRFAATTGLSLQTAKEFIAKYFETFPKIREFMDEAVTFATVHGYSKTLLGRKRNIDGLKQQSGLTFVNARNVAINAPIQGTAADLIKLAMIRIDTEFKKQKVSGKMLLQIHDELVFECHPDEVERLTSIIREGMEGAMNLSVPLDVSIGHGKNWWEAHQ
jgi:DNA polymerase-1